MSSYRVVEYITDQLRQLLAEGLRPHYPQEFSTEKGVSLQSPAELSAAEDEGTSLALYLYRVSPNPHLNNRPDVATGAGKRKAAGVSVDLHYLLVPMMESATRDLEVLGRAMQILAASSVIESERFATGAGDDDSAVRVSLEQLDLEELTRLWNAFNEPYRLSASYLVRTATIDSTAAPKEGEPVEERLLDIRHTDRGDQR